MTNWLKRLSVVSVAILIFLSRAFVTVLIAPFGMVIFLVAWAYNEKEEYKTELFVGLKQLWGMEK
jgi:hypothetical protein